ncbi:hypothetical protein LR48_Vigan08g087000 [Vigna angularis]|uniref:Putative plant transposon protein domain-containing protein n=1 Tax=Phaseolus angularis TaxID=3914 RepID=A0A0L9V519_PHAAN|nr:hypothetical protein LR48_Vigan08g087000 [Vigna angularis]
MKKKSDSRLPLSEGGDPPPPPSPPSRHDKWKLARIRPSGSYTSESAREISESIQIGQEAWPTTKKAHLSEDDPLGALDELAKIISDVPMNVHWDSTTFGREAQIPLYLHHQDVRELASGRKEINMTLTQLWMMYDPDSINNFLDTVWAGEQCQFALCMEEGVDFEDVEIVLCISGGHFQRNRSGSVVNTRRTDLTPLAKYWMAFSHANIQPCSHVSDITLSRALFIYCAIRNLNVNIGQVIADEISVCANTSNNKAPLGHPSLITHLCKLAGVDTSVPPFERPRKAIDEAYYRQYCGGEDVAQPVPPRRARRERGPAQSQTSADTHEAEPFQMRDMYMSLIGAQLQSIHRGQVATAEMIVGMYDTPPAHRWTMDEFHNVVAWPEEPVHGGGAGAAEASAREMEEDEAEEEDAFDDDEDEEEEEDTEDSSD